MATAHRIVAAKLRPSSSPGCIGQDHQRRDEQQTDDAHRHDDRDRREDRQQDVEGGHRQAAGARVLLILRDGEEAWPSTQVTPMTRAARTAKSTRSPLLVVSRLPKRYAVRLAGVPVGEGHEHHAEGDASVEHHGQREVTAGAPAQANELDRRRQRRPPQ